MSKKKVSGNTMTLKDFHGGSIPLPSAPGAVVSRPNDRPSYDRPTSAWGNPNQRSRPHTSPATWHVDDKPLFLAQSVHIGRNFDEDERTPLDGVSVPRRAIRDDVIRVAPEPKPLFSSPPLFNSGNGGRGGVGGAQPNAWAVRKEVGGVSEAVAVQPVWSGQSGVVKLANASAIEKVSSGRWKSKPSMQYQQTNSNIDAVRPADAECGVHSRGYDGILARQMERGLQIDDGIRNYPQYEGARGPVSSDVRERNPMVRKELPDYERGRVPIAAEARERKPTVYGNRVQPAPTEEQPFASSEPVERPKLKLILRTRSVDHLEAPISDQTQEYQHPIHVETVKEVYGNMNSTRPGSASSETAKLAVDRPKLNLKPRSQPLEHMDVIAERERNALFGGARPRELVLKARGVDDVVINEPDMVQHSNKAENRVQRTDHPRAEHHSPKHDRVPGHANPTGYPGKADTHPSDLRMVKKLDRRDSQVDRADTQNSNWCNDGRKNNRETDRQIPQSERPPSPETWRKPEQPKPSTPDGAGLHYGKTASAIELAQGFSRSVSANDRISAQKGIPTHGQVPFSRLTGPTPRPQLNGF